MKSTFKVFVLVAAAWFAMHVSGAAQAADWGSIKGRFILDGTPAKLTPIDASKEAYCLEKKPVNEAIVVGKENALVNTVVYLRAPAGGTVAVHPDYEKEFKTSVVLDNKDCSFHPHITLIRKKQGLTIKNSDPPPVGHNTNVPLFAFNQTIPPGQKVDLTATATGGIPMPLGCNIHPFMKGYILSLDHPYATVSDNDGKFEIKNLPIGEHEFQFWHEAAGYLKNIKFKGGVADARGRAKLKIAAGETLDLGDIKIPAATLKETP